MSSFDQKSQDQKFLGLKSASHNGRNLVTRWRIFAQRRLDHLIELYQSGRWKLYYKEQDFLAMVQEARAALQVWEQLAPPDPVLDTPVEAAIAQDEMPDGNNSGLARVLLNGVDAEHDPRKS